LVYSVFVSIPAAKMSDSVKEIEDILNTTMLELGSQKITIFSEFPMLKITMPREFTNKEKDEIKPMIQEYLDSLNLDYHIKVSRIDIDSNPEPS